MGGETDPLSISMTGVIMDRWPISAHQNAAPWPPRSRCFFLCHVDREMDKGHLKFTVERLYIIMNLINSD